MQHFHSFDGIAFNSCQFSNIATKIVTHLMLFVQSSNLSLTFFALIFQIFSFAKSLFEVSCQILSLKMVCSKRTSDDEYAQLISVYKPGDVGISSNLIGSPSLASGHRLPPGRWIIWGGSHSRFVVKTEGEIFQMLTFLECVVLIPSMYMLIYSYSLQPR